MRKRRECTRAQRPFLHAFLHVLLGGMPRQMLASPHCIIPAVGCTFLLHTTEAQGGWALFGHLLSSGASLGLASITLPHPGSSQSLLMAAIREPFLKVHPPQSSSRSRAALTLRQLWDLTKGLVCSCRQSQDGADHPVISAERPFFPDEEGREHLPS